MDNYYIYVGDVYLEGTFQDLETVKRAARDYSRNLFSFERIHGNVNIRKFGDNGAMIVVKEYDYSENFFMDM